jgi:hypothetical protein
VTWYFSSIQQIAECERHPKQSGRRLQSIGGLIAVLLTCPGTPVR